MAPPLAAQARDVTRICSTSGRNAPTAHPTTFRRAARRRCLSGGPFAPPLLHSTRPGLLCHAVPIHDTTSSTSSSTPSTTSTSPGPVSFDLALLALAAAAWDLAGPAAAAAEEVIKYDKSAGEGLIKSLSGLLYVGLLGFFLVKTFNRRTRQAREEVRGWPLGAAGRSVACCACACVRVAPFA
jgi:hypothetical protein